MRLPRLKLPDKVLNILDENLPRGRILLVAMQLFVVVAVRDGYPLKVVPVKDRVSRNTLRISGRELVP